MLKEFGFKGIEGIYAIFVGWTGYTWNKHYSQITSNFERFKRKKSPYNSTLHPAAGVRYFEVQYEDI